LYRQHCHEPWGLQNALVNLALAAKREHRNQAAELLGEATSLGEPKGWVAAWHADINARLLLEQGDEKGAERAYRELLERSEVAPSSTQCGCPSRPRHRCG
jgi:hypothetical protein